MANFPIPTSGTAWASGGISGRVGVKGGNKMRAKRGSKFRKKPWESTNWIPYISNFNNEPFAEDAPSWAQWVRDGAAYRVFTYAPSLMNQSTLLGQANWDEGKVATEMAVKLRRMQGHIHFDGMYFIQHPPAEPELLVTPAQAEQGAVQRVWWSWQREHLTPQGYLPGPTQDVGMGPAMLSGVHGFQRRDVMSWGIIDWLAQPVSSLGVFQGQSKGDRTYVIPNPRLPPGGLKLGIGEALTCVVRVTPGLQYGFQLNDFGNDAVALPITMQFQPYMRLLVSA